MILLKIKFILNKNIVLFDTIKTKRIIFENSY